MLKGIPSLISPELLALLSAMGHGDELVIADGNFPAASSARRLVRSDGHPVPEILDAVLSLIPLDQYDEQHVALMEVVPGDPAKPEIWETFRTIIKRHEPEFGEFAMIERFAFYERAKRAFAVVATGETSLYANVIVKKGVL